jgi:hypothetical protein
VSRPVRVAPRRLLLAGDPLCPCYPSSPRSAESPSTTASRPAPAAAASGARVCLVARRVDVSRPPTPCALPPRAAEPRPAVAPQAAEVPGRVLLALCPLRHLAVGACTKSYSCYSGQGIAPKPHRFTVLYLPTLYPFRTAIPTVPTRPSAAIEGAVEAFPPAEPSRLSGFELDWLQVIGPRNSKPR